MTHLTMPDSQRRPGMTVIDVAGASVSYASYGQGPGLVFAAGAGLSADVTFGHLVGEFTSQRTVILPDYAGSGETVDLGGPLTAELLAEQAAAAAAHAAPGPADVAGFGLGGIVAATMAATRPELVRRLVLISCWPSRDDPYHQLSTDVWLRLERGDATAFSRFLLLTCFSPAFLTSIGPDGVADLIAAAPPAGPGMRRQLELARAADLRPLLPRITAPTLVVGCSRDRVVPASRAWDLHQAIAGSQYAEFDSGHLVMFERPDELAALCTMFLLG
jgi:pimeloyl-ACP methyl ester carboxylesterase